MANIKNIDGDNLPVAVVGSQDGTLTEQDGIDLLEYLNIVRRRWLLVAFCTLLFAGVAAFFTFRMTRIYRATTVVRIETQAPQVLGRNVEDVVEMGTGSFWSNVEYYETQYKIIESRKIALAVVDEYGLAEDASFMGLAPEKMPASREVAAEKLQSLLTVEPIQDSRLVNIHIDYHEPAKAQLYANAIAEAYLKQNLGIMHTRTLEAVDWLGERLDEAHSLLLTAEKALHQFKKENNILSISLEDRQSHITAQMHTAAQNLTQAKSRRIELQSRKRAVAQVTNIDDPMAIPVSALNNSPLIQQLKQDYAVLSQEKGELSARYGENFPKMVELDAKLTRIQADIKREVTNIIRAIDAELKEAQLTETGLKKALEELEDQAQELANNYGAYNDLARSVTHNEQVYELLKGRSEEAKLSRFLQVNNVEILDAALLPKAPIKPRVMLNIALALFLGAIVGIALAIVLEIADRTIKSEDDLEKMGVSFLGIVPAIDSAGAGGYSAYGGGRNKRHKLAPTAENEEPFNYDNFVFDHPKSQVAESLRSIRTNIHFMAADNDVHSLLVTSPSPQEGKTTVAANLAIVMAQSGSRVLLVDTDMRRPRVHKAFGITRPVCGMSTMILGETKLDESVVSSRIPNLDLLPCGPTPPNPSELIHTDAFKRVRNELLAHYDRVIFDSPPVGVVTDAAILSKMVDGTILVVKSLKTTRDAAKHAISRIRDIDSPILGAILNGLDLANKKYGKYYYYYYSKYGYYYGEGDGSRDSKKKSRKQVAHFRSGK